MDSPAPPGAVPGPSEPLREQRERLLEDGADLARRLDQLAESNRLLAARCREVERRHLSLLSLYVAALRLHASLRRDEFLTALQEVLASLVGCEQAALFELERGVLHATARFGVTVERVPSVPLGTGVIGGAAASAKLYIATEQPAPEGVSACAPLVLDGRLVGAIALFDLLSHKLALGEDDRDLLELLSSHAAVALRATALEAGAAA